MDGDESFWNYYFYLIRSITRLAIHAVPYRCGAIEYDKALFFIRTIVTFHAELRVTSEV